MNWQERILSAEEMKPYLDAANADHLAAQVAALIAQQKHDWPQLHEGYAALAQIDTKRLLVDGSTVIVQHNPKRVRSTAAAVDQSSIAARQCFLCPENLPAAERGIAYEDEFVILCNPYPVLDNHLVIAHRHHLEQKIEGRIETLLGLTGELGEAYFVLYNGAECGASAPDHFHLQALSREGLPIAASLQESEPLTETACGVCEDLQRGNFALFTINDAGRSVIVLRGASRVELAAWLYATIEGLAKATHKTEPLMNLVAYCERGVYTVLLFPRARHRPDCFFAEGEARLVISPGAVDMAGILVVPEHAHYEKLDAEMVAAIFSQVSLPSAYVEEVVGEVCEA
ncbi:MAG: DUF4922 domain-containing protein [Acidobacteria bacterium]|nr:DUF4922 domain-containing protein [Acidobacteriota bacterium]